MRLMVRPTTNHKKGGHGNGSMPASPISYTGTPVRAPLSPTSMLDIHGNGTGSSTGSLSPLMLRANRTSQLSSHPSSLVSALTDLSAHSSIYYPDDVWTGTNTDADWERCRRLMRRFGRDGKKLELWRLWLGFYHPEHKERFMSTADHDENEGKSIDKGKQRQKQWTEDDGPLPSEVTAAEIVLSKETVAIAPREHIIPVLRTHVCFTLSRLSLITDLDILNTGRRHPPPFHFPGLSRPIPKAPRASWSPPGAKHESRFGNNGTRFLELCRWLGGSPWIPGSIEFKLPDWEKGRP